MILSYICHTTIENTVRPLASEVHSEGQRSRLYILKEIYVQQQSGGLQQEEFHITCDKQTL